jgi:single-strand DNA-binding protein
MHNEANLIARIGKKDIRTLKNGTDMATLYVATSKKWTDGDGKKQEQTTWHNVNCFHKLSDIVKRYANVGDLIHIKGEINNKQVTSGEKAGQWSYSITATHVTLLPNGSKKEDKPSTNNKQSHPHDFSDDDIMF